MTAPVKAHTTRAEFAERLLKGSVRKSYEPVVDIDWDAPLEPDKFFLPPRMVSLYGTPIWEAMSRTEQIELSRQELANILSAGVWFENILNQALLRKMMHADPTASTTHYELTELGDETRHMVMFGKAITKIGAAPVRPRLFQRIAINSLPFLFRGSVLWGAALVGEEIFDAMQRQILDDADIQPVVLRLMRIHVTEEARHIQYARDGLRKRVPAMPWWKRAWVGNLHGLGGPFYRYLFTVPAPYNRVGLDGQAARKMARRNPYHHAAKVQGFSSLAAFFEDVGLMGRVGRRLWRRSGFLPGGPVQLLPEVAEEGEFVEDVYDGPATVDGKAVRVRLTGHLHPIDGQYHWQGTVFETLQDGARNPISITIGDRTASARFTERTQQGGYSIAGVGAPPFAR